MADGAVTACRTWLPGSHLTSCQILAMPVRCACLPASCQVARAFTSFTDGVSNSSDVLEALVLVMPLDEEAIAHHLAHADGRAILLVELLALSAPIGAWPRS
ncbi:hypothetical protein ACP4OV_001648 [Aristida adscensionis]